MQGADNNGMVPFLKGNIIHCHLRRERCCCCCGCSIHPGIHVMQHNTDAHANAFCKPQTPELRKFFVDLRICLTVSITKRCFWQRLRATS